MAVLKLHPRTKKVRRDEETFLRLIGECVTGWAFVDRAIFRVFRQTLGVAPNMAAAVYYDRNTLNQRRDLTNKVMAQKYAPASTILTRWLILNSEISRLAPVRNSLAHQPAQRTGTVRAGRPHSYYSIHVEPQEVRAGLRKPKEFLVADLRSHLRDADKLRKALLSFAEWQMQPSAPQSKPVSRKAAKI